MKTTILLFIISLFINGVVTHESVSVMEGDSVTLYTNTVIHKGYLIEWRFGDDHYLIARVNGGTNRVKIYADVLNGRFRDRLQVNDQTGDLTFTNITTQHTGLYQLEIINMGNTTKTFNINVFGDKVKTVMMGDSFILHNNVIKKSGDEKIVWRIQHNSSTVAEIIRNGKETNDKVHDERFRGRLKVDDQTGDLIITNITTEDFGSYEVDITVGRHTYTIHRSFTVKVVSSSCGFMPICVSGSSPSPSQGIHPRALGSATVAFVCLWTAHYIICFTFINKLLTFHLHLPPIFYTCRHKNRVNETVRMNEKRVGGANDDGAAAGADDDGGGGSATDDDGAAAAASRREDPEEKRGGDRDVEFA
ncbi:uncharacterized protein [Paramisgurnus dabryanus]|uniref:uncharacterized protein isoform X2 n=1 Tax=Paramisgurnus dabryanus TaxID=90735 RepID=UPI0031F36F43